MTNSTLGARQLAALPPTRPRLSGGIADDVDGMITPSRRVSVIALPEPPILAGSNVSEGLLRIDLTLFAEPLANDR